MTPKDPRLQAEIEQQLIDALPQVELLSCEQAGGERIRLVIDHPDGVDLGLCEQVTTALRALLTDFALEVSSPGPERPLTKPDHFRRFVGRRARVRTHEPRERGRDAGKSRSFTGELVGANSEAVTIAAADGVVSLAYEEIARGNLLSGEGDSEASNRRDDQ